MWVGVGAWAWVGVGGLGGLRGCLVLGLAAAQSTAAGCCQERMAELWRAGVVSQVVIEPWSQDGSYALGPRPLLSTTPGALITTDCRPAQTIHPQVFAPEGSVPLPEEEAEMAKAAVSNLVGSMGYFYGSSQVRYGNISISKKKFVVALLVRCCWGADACCLSRTLCRSILQWLLRYCCCWCVVLLESACVLRSSRFVWGAAWQTIPSMTLRASACVSLFL